MKKRWFCLGLLLGTAVMGSASFFINREMMKIVLKRETPKHMEQGAKWFSGSNLLAEYGEEISLASRQLEESSGFQSVGLTARDGVRLVGHWREHPNPKRVILAMHG